MDFASQMCLIVSPLSHRVIASSHHRCIYLIESPLSHRVIASSNSDVFRRQMRLDPCIVNGHIYDRDNERDCGHISRPGSFRWDPGVLRITLNSLVSGLYEITNNRASWSNTELMLVSE